MQYIDEALEFYNDEKVRELDGERFDFDELIEELNYDLLGNSVPRFTVREIDPELLSRASRVLEEYYQRELEKNPSPTKCWMKYTVIISPVCSIGGR